MSEKPIQNRIMLALGRIPTLRVFRNHVGQGVTGRIEAVAKPKTYHLGPGDFVVRGGRRCSFGLAPDTPDLVGWETVTITAAMVGKTVALIYFVEVKDQTGKLSEGQERFINFARTMGVKVVVARSADEAVHGIVGGELDLQRGGK